MGAGNCGDQGEWPCSAIIQPNSHQLVVVYGVAMVDDISFGDDDDSCDENDNGL